MKHVKLKDLPEIQVSHAPDIKKHVYAHDISCIRKISHAVFQPGDTARPHAHEEGWEIYYCAGGEAVFGVNGGDVLLESGDCLIVEPGDLHEIKEVRTRTELFYLFVS